VKRCWLQVATEFNTGVAPELQRTPEQMETKWNNALHDFRSTCRALNLATKSGADRDGLDRVKRSEFFELFLRYNYQHKPLSNPQVFSASELTAAEEAAGGDADDSGLFKGAAAWMGVLFPAGVQVAATAVPLENMRVDGAAAVRGAERSGLEGVGSGGAAVGEEGAGGGAEEMGGVAPAAPSLPPAKAAAPPGVRLGGGAARGSREKKARPRDAAVVAGAEMVATGLVAFLKESEKREEEREEKRAKAAAELRKEERQHEMALAQQCRQQ